MNHNIDMVFLPIKPKYIYKILDGSKKYEFRKNIPKRQFTYALIYASSPDKKLVGAIKVKSIINATPELLWERTKEYAGISKMEYRNYFDNRSNAFAYEIEKVFEFREAIDLEKIKEIISIPQSFLYLQPKDVEVMIGAENWSQIQ